MDFSSPFHLIPLSKIDFADKTYAFIPWESMPDEQLLRSIEKFGILHPPIAKRTRNDSYCIVSGRKRLLAIQHLGEDNSVLCRIIPAGTEETEIFSLILEENEAGKSFTLTQTVFFFNKLLKTASFEEALPFLKKLGYKSQKHILHGLLQLNDLDESVLLALHHGILHEKNARRLLNLSLPDQALLVQLVREYNFGGSKQQKLVEYCSELINRNNLPLNQIIAGFQTPSEKEQPENTPQHGLQLLAWLHQQCFPRSSIAEENFKHHIARLNLPPTIQIHHVPSFETEEITVSLRFSDMADMEKRIDTIKHLMLNK